MPEAAKTAQLRYASKGRRMVMGLLLAAAILLIISVGMAAQTMIAMARQTQWVEHTLLAEATINQLAARNERVETARRGYLIEPDASFQRVVRGSDRDFVSVASELRARVKDNPRQLQLLEEAVALHRARMVGVARMIDGVSSPSRIGNFNTDPSVLATRRIRSLLDTMNASEQRLLAERNNTQLSLLRRLYLIGGLALALLMTSLVVTIVLMMRFNRELTSAQTRLQAVNEGLEEAVAARTTELTRANDEIQRFAYIVSHDLRSPLVNVLGFTAELDAARKTLHEYLTKLYAERPELKDQGAWLAVEEDLPEALGFIRTSTEKMDRLINSILDLSRQGRRPLRPEPLDLTELSENVAATLKQRADAAGATVLLSPLPSVTSDRMAVEQILSNLIENALKYLSPKRAGEVRVEGRKAGSWIEIDVIDNGRGIAPADHERIFDLFRRAGAQDQAGEGIGLANVRALAYRLGGRVTVQSQLDEGARFTLTLPEKFTAAEPS